MSAYYINFQNIINYLDLDDHVKIMFFCNDIHEKIKELLIGQDKIPTTFINFIQLYIRLDNNIRAFEIERTYKNLGTLGTCYIGRKKAPKKVQPDRIHTLVSWTCCYDDRCLTHLSEKEGSNY